uniref:hypothetical protein n=1 Tax=Nocardia abscessus TaxID=120957 RepID=UPI002456E25C
AELVSGNPAHGLPEITVLLIQADWLTAMIAFTNRRVRVATNGLQSPAATAVTPPCRTGKIHADRATVRAGPTTP